jgi:hypothetical protein
VRGRLAVLALLAVLAAGCGSSSAGTKAAGDASSLVPSSALGYIAANTDFGAGPLKSAEAILDKFPVKPKALDRLKASLQKQGIDADALASSIGPETDIAILRVNHETGAVAYTQPTDEKTFDAELDKGQSPAVHTVIDGWTVFSDKQAFLDAVTSRKANLADDPSYQAAKKTIPALTDAIATAYASPLGIAAGTMTANANLPTGTTFGLGQGSEWATGAVTSADDAFKLQLHAKSTTPRAAAASKASALAASIPSGSIVALSLTRGAGTIPANLRSQVNAVSGTLGFDLGGLLDALNGPVIAYVRAGLPIPEVTIAAQPPHPKRAAAAVGLLIRRLTQNQYKPVPTKVDGGTLLKVDLGSVAIYYGAPGGRLVVTDSANALAELNGSAGKLSDDAIFKEARDGSGMPDTSQGFLFVNLKDAVPAVQGFAALANQTIPPTVMENLKPLRSLLVYGSRDGGLQNLVFYVKTNP